MLREQSVAAPLSFERLVSGRLVHRRQLSDVLVTDARPLGGDRFESAVQWPRNHVLLGRSGRVDSALVAETVRQVTTYIAHTLYDVPLGNQFLMSRLRTRVILPPPSALAGSDLVVEVVFTDVRRGVSGPTAFVSHLRITQDGREIASGEGFARVVTPEAYRRVRAGIAQDDGPPIRRHPAEAVSPAVAGVAHAGLVVIGRSAPPAGFALLVDPLSPAFFDHDLDHVPGMLVVEGLRQTARAVLGDPAVDFATLDLSFDRMIELSDDPEIRVTGLGGSPALPATAEIVREGVVLAHGSFVVT